MRKFLENLPYFIVFILFLESFGAGNANFSIILSTYGILFFSLCLSVFLCYKEGKNDKIYSFFIILSFSLGLLYIYNTPFNARQHDTGGLIMNGRGHLHYISWLLEKHTLPFLHQSPGLPIEHPPLYYIIAALFVKCISLIKGVSCTSLLYGTYPHDFLCESLQYLTLFFVVGTMYLFYHTIKLLKISFGNSLLIFILMSSYPLFIFLSGSLGNDSALLFFSTLSILFFIRYVMLNQLKELYLSAFFTALTLLVKSSAIAVVIGTFLFLCIAWIKKYYSFKKTLFVGLIYGLISLPLGLSWNIHNYLRWDSTPTTNSHLHRVQLEREKTYNPILHTAITNDDQNISAYSYFDRLLITIEPEKNPFIRTQKPYEYNIWNALIKSSLFDEYSFFSKEDISLIKKIGYWTCVILWYLNCAFFVLFALAFIASRKDIILSYLKCIVFSFLVTFIVWCFVNPCWSAALARYIPVSFLCMALVNYKYIDQFSEAHKQLGKNISVIITFYTFSFAILSNLFFILFFLSR